MRVEFNLREKVFFLVTCSDSGRDIYEIEATDENHVPIEGVYDKHFVLESDEYWDAVYEECRNGNELLFDDFQ